MSVLNDADALKWGTVTVNKAYMGTTEVWPAGGPPPGNAFVSDEFNDSSLDPMWTVFDPLTAGATAVESGTVLTMSVPVDYAYDPSHDPSYAFTVLQDVDDEDFTIEMRSPDVAATQYSWIGIWVEEDGNDWMRFVVRSSGIVGKNHVEVKYAVAGSGTTEIYDEIFIPSETRVKVDRSGDDWTFSYWDNFDSYVTKSSFAHSMTVNKVGLFIGTYLTAPAWSVDMDWIRNIA